jgi:hypothetical protein
MQKPSAAGPSRVNTSPAMASGPDIRDLPRFEVPAGGIAWLGRGVPHTFANLTTSRVKVIGFMTPAGLEGMFEETAAYLGSLSSPPDPAHIARIGERYGVKSVGPPIQAPPAREDGAGSST